MNNSSHNQDLNEVIEDLENLRLEYQVVYFTEDNSVEVERFGNAQPALEFYIEAADEQSPILKCLITASRNQVFRSCIAPIRLRSLTDIVDAEKEIPEKIKNTALEALAKSIINELPFNSEAHGCII